MDLVAGAVGSVIRKLGELLQKEYKLQKGLPEQIDSLKNELESAHTALCKVGELPPEQLDPQVRLWAREVRETSYDMEDILDTFLVSIVEVYTTAENKDGLLKRLQKRMAKLFKKSKARHTIGGAIEDMKKRLQEVTDRRDRFSVAVALSAPATKPDPRLADMHKEAAQLIGINKARAELIAMLLPLSHSDGDSDVSGGNKMKIVSVVGVGGLGKTTLAKAVYDELEPQCDCRAFVSIGRKPDLVQVFKDIFLLLDKKEYGAIREVKNQSLLIGELRKFLQNKRYLIVIDDVWDIPTWKAIKSAFVENDSGSRVITTTRNREVASREEVYELHPLSRDSSEKLFYTRLFGIKGECPANHPAEASEKILKKCGGVPLAIITMASMLVGKSREDWIAVCNSPGFYHGNDDQQVHDAEWILSLSYYDLPSNLKTCLLYLSVYPEEYMIMKDDLIWKWIAEGFIEKKIGTSLFQQGEEYFNQLINRSLIQAVQSESMGIIYGCRVHDMVLDLICDLSDEENFVTILNDDEVTSPQKKVRRLAHKNRMMKRTRQDNHMGVAQVRSLVACRCDIGSWVLHPSFKVLRVLALEGCRVSWEGCQGLQHLANLLHLRYLGLRGTFGNHELPEEIGKLKFLQTLDLEASGIRILPLGVCQLMQLVCLHGGDHTSTPDGLLRKVTSLEDLRIRIDNLNDESKQQFMKELGNLSEARVLKIICSLKGIVQSDLMQSIGNLHKLQHLELADYYYFHEKAIWEWDRVVLPRHLRHLSLYAIRFPRLPSCISPAHLHNLYYLRLAVDHMNEASLRALGGLPELHYLELSTNHMDGEGQRATVANITTGDGFFKKLRDCVLFGWMFQLVLNESSTSVSFSIWNGNGAMSFVGSRTKDECSRSVPPTVMPNLQELRFEVPVRALYEDGKGIWDNLGLEFLASIHKVRVVVDCKGASADDVGKAEAELRHAAELHPNRPIIDIQRSNRHKMMAQSTDQAKEEAGTKVTSLEEVQHGLLDGRS
ncbi:unnamed protein product [Urochloa humidicola]